eukprot:1071398-Amphidinium_carterae.2
MRHAFSAFDEDLPFRRMLTMTYLTVDDKTTLGVDQESTANSMSQRGPPSQELLLVNVEDLLEGIRR